MTTEVRALAPKQPASATFLGALGSGRGCGYIHAVVKFTSAGT